MKAMLRSLKDLEGYSVRATDGDVGSVSNFLVDDERWAVRYLVVEAEPGRQVLISPISFQRVDWGTHHFHVALTMDKVKKSPDIDASEPVSRQHELDFSDYYGYPYYWGALGAWGMGAYPGTLAGSAWRARPPDPSKRAPGDVHLRSVREVCGYHIQGTDDKIGHVDDFIVDDETWEIRYLVIDTSNWWLGKKVLLAPAWADRVSWLERLIYVHVSRQFIKSSPEWDATPAGLNRQYEKRLYDYYARPFYWESLPRRPTAATHLL
jgi:sporulation protein YlmC with PRC-barrel domain